MVMQPKQPDYIQYPRDILSGKIPACELVKLACKRFFADLERDDLEFRYDEADQAIKFIQLLRHTKGKWKGQLLMLEPWQKFIVANIFGFYWLSGKRRFTQSYLEMPKKNGKSPLAGACAAYEYVMREDSPEIYSIATELPQARISWKYAADMLYGLDKDLEGELGISVRDSYNDRRILMDGDTGSIFAPLSFGDNDKHDGKSVCWGLVDEYHAHKNDRAYGILADGVGARENPHIMIITTAGFDRSGPCFAHRELCEQILRGGLADDSQFIMIYTSDKGDDWTSEETWIKVNPNYEVSVSRESFTNDLTKAKNDPSKENAFRIKKLNEWRDVYTAWIPTATIKRGDTGFKPEPGMTGWGALDLGRVSDFSSITLNFFEGKHRFWTRYYMPSVTLEKWGGQIGDNLRQWAKQGYITVTEGESTDYAFIERDIKEFFQTYDLVSMGYDPYNATDLATRLINSEGLNMRSFPQNIKEMNLPTKTLGEVLIDGKFEYDGNPVTLWMWGNVKLYSDANNNKKIVKSVKGQEDRNKKVDGPVTWVMALGEAIDENNQPATFTSFTI